jgi:hypothetical protein
MNDGEIIDMAYPKDITLVAAIDRKDVKSLKKINLIRISDFC